MFVVKHLPAGQKIVGVTPDLRAVKARYKLPPTRDIAGGVMRALQPLITASPVASVGVERCIEHWVSEERRFVEAQTTPAASVASFYEHVGERVHDFSDCLINVVGTVLQAVPDQQDDTGVLYIEVPLISLLRNSAGLIQAVVETLVKRNFDGGELHLGAAMSATVVARLCQASGMSQDEARRRHHRLKWPKDMSVSGEALVSMYLRDTPLEQLLLLPVHVRISDKVRMEHCLITAGAGHGKTQTLQHMIACDLDRPRDAEVGMVVIDSQGDLISNIQKLKRFADNDRLLVVDASDVEYPVALNIFDLGGGSLDHLSQRDREQALAATVQLYEYVIGGLFGAEMTQKQSTVFRFLIRLMLSIPQASIHTLRECLEEPKNFINHMERLPATARQFFINEFLDRQFNDTRKQILRRLYGVLQNPAFERMFASNENRLNLYKALNEGRVVVCNTSREFLQEECRVFGRYCIAVALKAAFDRARIPLEQRRTSYLYIDEASDYFDESVGQLLAQARKYRLGVVLAHQALEQMSEGLRAIVMSNTSVKLAGGASVRDARSLSGELRTTPEYILAQEKHGHGTRFATFVRNVTPAAVSWSIPFMTMERLPRMSTAELSGVIARNRDEVSSGSIEAPSQAGQSSEPAPLFKTSADNDDFSESY